MPRERKSILPARRSFNAKAVAGLVSLPLLALPRGGAAEPKKRARRTNGPPLEDDLVFAFVTAAHRDLKATRELLESQPAVSEPGLIFATWDWGRGDVESALNGAAHMGRRDIAEFLLHQGARMDLFCAAMLGLDAVVKGVLTAFPGAIHWRGPHGISLLRHAEAGGNADLVRFLRVAEAR